MLATKIGPHLSQSPASAQAPLGKPERALKWSPKNHQNLLARVRTDLLLIEKYIQNPTYLGSHTNARNIIDKIKNQLQNALDQRILIYPPLFQIFGLKFNQTLKKRKEILGLITQPTADSPTKTQLLKMLEKGADSVREANWRWRAGQWIEEMQQKGWYGFFVTMTLDPAKFSTSHQRGQSITDELNRTMRHAWQLPKQKNDGYNHERLGIFQEWKTRVCRSIWRNSGVPESDMRQLSERTIAQHMCVIEHGKSSRHHHAHCLIFFKTVPGTWIRDPMRSFSPTIGDTNSHNQCPELSTFWTWSQPQNHRAEYFRHLGDVWKTKHNFKTPIKNGQGLKLMAPQKAGAYLTKYLQKDVRQWNHRVKATRGIGLCQIRQQIRRLQLRHLKSLTEPMPPTLSHYDLRMRASTTISPPISLLTTLSQIERYRREYLSTPLKTLLKPKPEIFSKLLVRSRPSRNTTPPWQLPSPERWLWLQTSLHTDQSEFSEADFKETIIIIREKFPYQTSTPVQGIANI